MLLNFCALLYGRSNNNFYFDTYQKFREALADFFKNLSRYKSELNNLITWNFQIIQWD